MKALVALALICGTAVLHAQSIDPEKLKTAVEALERLKGTDLDSNPKLKSSVGRILQATKGTPQYVQIVKDFNLKDQTHGLIEFAQLQPSSSQGVEAMRMVLEADAKDAITAALKSSKGAATAEALGNTGSRKMLPLLQPLLADTGLEKETKAAAIKALTRNEEGAKWLLDQVPAKGIPEDLLPVAKTELTAASWSEVKDRAAKLFQTQTEERKFPPVAELMAMKGDPKRGAEIFKKQEVGCANCHQVNSVGVDFGPKLSEIGTKLGKDALYQSIIDPNNGIAFGYEAWELETKDGDEAFGLIVSETADEVTLKIQSGITTNYRKADLKKREKKEQSIMPAGLEQTMSVQELADLVEYLSTLKKAT
ncbi:MAG TPA: c-type cytochrome [Methylomirabilota bacterium]|nr:c-type cytochrome [Methylomirabilota bacterium]